jgi:RNA polymerase sigma factor (sigma-70 family)
MTDATDAPDEPQPSPLRETEFSAFYMREMPRVRALVVREAELSTTDAPHEPQPSPLRETEFSAFYMREMPRLVAFTMRLGADLNEAHDIAQQVFVNAYRLWSTIEYPSAYLRTAASREFIRRSSDALREEPLADLPDAAAMPDPAVAKVEFRDQEARIFQAIKSLPYRQRQVMAWTLDGFTPSEISEILGISPVAVRGSLLKARRELKVRLNITQGGDDNA